MIRGYLEFLKNYLCTCELWGGMLMLNALSMHFHFTTIEIMMIGGGYGMLISNAVYWRYKTFFAHPSVSYVL